MLTIPFALNALPPALDLSGSFLSFREQLKCHLLSVFPDHPHCTVSRPVIQFYSLPSSLILSETLPFCYSLLVYPLSPQLDNKTVCNPTTDNSPGHREGEQ